MKQRSTTPVSIGFATKAISVAVAVLSIVAVPMTFSSQVLADKYDDQINALRSMVADYQAQASDLGVRAATLQAELDKLTNEKNIIQAQIDLSQAKYDKLVHQIAETEKKIVDNKEALGQILADMQVEGSITPLEMLASSKDISEYVDREQYQASIQDTLSKTIKQIKSLKVQLEEQKKEVERVLSDQKNQRDALAAKEAEQAQLLADTKGEEAAYQGLASQANAQIASLQAQQAAELAARARSTGGYSASRDGSNGGYPFMAGPLNYTVDPWGMYARQCVSYAAFKVDQAYGNMPYWGGDRYVRGEFLSGHAKYWARAAELAGIPTGYTPKPGSVGVVTTGEYGHVAWVEAVNPNGTIRISHYNVGWDGNYAVWDNLSPSYFNKYIYFGG